MSAEVVVTIPRFPASTITMETKKLSIPTSLSSIIMNQQNTNITTNKMVKKSDFSMASILLNKKKEKDQHRITEDEETEKDENPSVRRTIANHQDRRHHLKQPLICRLENHNNVPATSTTTPSLRLHNNSSQQKKSILLSEKIFSHSQHVEHHHDQHNLRHSQQQQQQQQRYSEYVRTQHYILF